MSSIVESGTVGMCPDTGRPVYRGLPVPWAARWTGEVDLTPLHGRVAAGRYWVSLGNADAHPEGVAAGLMAGRDEHGVLWHADRDAPGSGEPQFRQLHARRQRACMAERRCQVCGRHFGALPTTFLEAAAKLPADPAAPFVTDTAPTCLTCEPVALRRCPAQRRTPRVLVTATTFEPYAVYGDLLGPALDGGIRYQVLGRIFPLGDRRLTRVVAKQLLVRITDYTAQPVRT